MKHLLTKTNLNNKDKMSEDFSVSERRGLIKYYKQMLSKQKEELFYLKGTTVMNNGMIDTIYRSVTLLTKRINELENTQP